MLYNLPTLTVESYQRWKFDVQAALESTDLLGYVDGSLISPVLKADNSNAAAVTEWKKQDARARLVISSSLDEEHHAAIRGSASAAEMWNTIKTLREQSSQTNKYLAQQEFHQYKYTPGMSISAYFSGLSIIRQKLESIQETVSDATMIAKAINDLPKEYNFFRQSYRISAAAGTALTLKDIQAQLQIVEQDIQKGDDTGKETGEALITKGPEKYKKRDKKFENKENKEKRKCWICGKQGHLKSNCKFNKSNDISKSEQKGLIINEGDISDKDWKGDSGCSSHMARDKGFFKNLEIFTNDMPITIGNGSRMAAKGRGTIDAELYNGTMWIKRQLLNVLWVPNLCEIGLISLGVLTDRGFKIEMKDKSLKVIDNNKVILTGNRNYNNLYSLKIRMIEQTAHIGSIKLWHERLAHVSPGTVLRMEKSNIVKGMEKMDTKEKFFCEGCAYGKMCKQPYKSKTTKCNEIGAVIHADVCGKMEVESLNRSLYYVEFKDEASHYTKVYFMHTKDQVLKRLKQFVAEQRAETGRIMKTFFSDNGKEFDNDGVKEFLLNHGIKHQTSAAYNPQQNGRAERENRTLVEHAKCMIHAKELPKKLWAEAINTTVYVLNRIPVSGNETTPYEQWFKKKPSVKHLRVFGTTCYVLIPQQFRKKWEPKSRKGKLVGYTDTDKNYRVWYEDKDRVDVVRDIKFDETSELKGTVTISLDMNMQQEEEKETPDEHKLDDSEDSHEEEPGGQGKIETPKTRKTISNATRSEEQEKRKLRDRSTLKMPDRYCEQCFLMTTIPTNYNEALECKEAAEWKNAMNEEYNSLLQNNTWELTDLPENRKAIKSKWVYTIKERPKTSPRYKARLVAKGYLQKPGIDYGEIFSPVMKMDSIRIILSLAAFYKLDIAHFDVKTAFLYGDLKEELYLEQPEGFCDGTGKVCRLFKGLYGLKQASRAWNNKLHGFLTEFGFQQVKSDHCVYFMKNHEIIVILGIYVDDGLLCCNSELIKDKILTYLKKLLEIQVEDANCFVGLEIDRDKNKNILKIHQKTYIKRILTRFNMLDCKTIDTPADANVRLSKPVEISDELMPFSYREVVGSLIYLMTGSRPDIAFVVSKLSQFIECHDKTHWTAIKRILRYLKGSIDVGITYTANGDNTLRGYCDSDYAGDIDSRRSTSGYIFMLNEGAISWSSKLQKTVALSTTEAEYIALAESTKQSLWLGQLLTDLGLVSDPISIHCDNQGALKLVKNPEHHQRTKHIDVRYHFIREAEREGRIAIKYLKTEDQLADILTKPLHRPRFKYCLNLIHLYDN